MSGTRRKPGCMGPFIEGFGGWLAERGYTPGSIRNVLKEAGQLGRWLAEVDVEASQLNVAVIDAFLDTCRARGTRRLPTVRSFKPLLEFLGSEGVLIGEVPPPMTLLEEVLAEYRSWLVVQRGLAAPTVLRYENMARRFLAEREAEDGSRFIVALTARHVIGFLLVESERVSVGAAKGRVAELRSLLRFLYREGLDADRSATAVPPVAGWHDTGDSGRDRGRATWNG